MFKLISSYLTGNAYAVDVGEESPTSPSTPTDPSDKADQRKDKVQKTSNERNIAAGVVTQPHRRRSDRRRGNRQAHASSREARPNRRCLTTPTVDRGVLRL